jgi:hypothetical protein
LHPDLQEHWTLDGFQRFHEELTEIHYRYVSLAIPVEVERVEDYTSQTTGKEYKNVVRVHVVLLQSVSWGDDERTSSEESVMMYF